MYCVILSTTKVFFIIVDIQKPVNSLNRLTNSVYEIYIFYFSYIYYFILNVFFIDKQILTYLASLHFSYQLFCVIQGLKIKPIYYCSKIFLSRVHPPNMLMSLSLLMDCTALIFCRL